MFRCENPFPGAGPTDPYTPLLRAYEGDKVQIRTLVGAHMAPHSFNLHGLNWLFEPADPNSGFRSTQGMGISEHYEMLFDLPRTGAPKQADYMYVSSSGTADLPSGNWGLLRAYSKKQKNLQVLPNNPVDKPGSSVAVCPPDAPVRKFHVTATTAVQALGGPLVYNARGRPNTPGKQRIVDWNALFYVHTSDLDSAGRLKNIGASALEPLILRAAAGDCLKVTLLNRIQPIALNVGRVQPYSPQRLYTSQFVGLHPQLVAENVTESNGVIIGRNPKDRVAEFGHTTEYTWYAGIVKPGTKGNPPEHVPVEFGSASLSPSDPLMQSPYGMIGALIIEPQGSCWKPDPNSRASANVFKVVKDQCDESALLFREHVTIVQDNLARLAMEKLPPKPPKTPPPPPPGPTTRTLKAAGGPGDSKWLLDGKPLPDKGQTANSVMVQAGDTIEVSVESGTHGFTFYDRVVALNVFDIVAAPGVSFKVQPSSNLSWGTDAQGAGPIARLTVKPDIKQDIDLFNIAFLDTVIGRDMTAVFRTGLPAENTPLRGNLSRAINYGTEPFKYRFVDQGTWEHNTPNKSPRGIMRSMSNTLVLGDPETPVFTSSKGMPVRIRMLHPSGLAEQTWDVHGHVRQEQPYVDGSTKIGTNPQSQWFGARDAFGPNSQFDIVIAKAGGEDEVIGDYLYRSFIGTDFFAGLWGIFRVGKENVDVVTITDLALAKSGTGYAIAGVNSVNPSNQKMAATVSITDKSGAIRAKVPVHPMTGAWELAGNTATKDFFPVKVVSAEGGVAVAPGEIQSAMPPDSVGQFVKMSEEMVEMGDDGLAVHVDGQQFKPIPYTDSE